MLEKDCIIVAKSSDKYPIEIRERHGPDYRAKL